MASPTFAITRFLRAQRQLGEAERPSQLSRRETYREIMEAVHELADEETHDDLMGWVVVEAVHDRVLPDPEELRDRARELCLYRDIEIPDASTLNQQLPNADWMNGLNLSGFGTERRLRDQEDWTEYDGSSGGVDSDTA